jgi:hypothetical protein
VRNIGEKRKPFYFEIDDAGLAAKSYFFVSGGKERKKKRRNPWGREEHFESTPPLFLLSPVKSQHLLAFTVEHISHAGCIHQRMRRLLPRGGVQEKDDP